MPPESDEVSIQSLLGAYRTHLTSSSASSCAALYASDGITMAQGFPSQIGRPAVEQWYQLCFSRIALDVEFHVHEIVLCSEEFAFARTTSKGTQKVLESGSVSAEANQELFVMKKIQNEWKIARYCFCGMGSA